MQPKPTTTELLKCKKDSMDYDNLRLYNQKEKNWKGIENTYRICRSSKRKTFKPSNIKKEKVHNAFTEKIIKYSKVGERYKCSGMGKSKVSK